MKNPDRTHIKPAYRAGLPHPEHPPALPESARHRVCFNGVCGITEEVEHKNCDEQCHYEAIGEVCEPLN